MSRARQKAYNRVNRDLHCEERYRQLTADARLVLMHLHLCPEVSPVPGLVRIRRSTLLEDLPMTPRRFAVAWSQLEAAGYTRADWDAGLALVVDGLDHNNPINGDVVRGWSKPLALLPKCALLTEALTHLRDSMLARGDDWAKASGEVFDFDPIMFGSASTPPRLQDQDQDQEQDQEKERETESAEPANSPKRLPASHTPSFDSERPSKAVRKTNLPANFRPSQPVWATLCETYRAEDLEYQLGELHKKEGGGQGERQVSWDRRFVVWIEAGERQGMISKKPPPRQPKPQPAAEPKKAKTVDEERAELAKYDTMIAQAKADPDLAWNLDTMIAARDALATKMAADHARLLTIPTLDDEPPPDSFLPGPRYVRVDADNDDDEAAS